MFQAAKSRHEALESKIGEFLLEESGKRKI